MFCNFLDEFLKLFISLKLIIPNSRATDGVKIINQLDDEVFTTVINYVHKNMNPSGTPDTDDDGGLEKLEQIVKIERTDFLLLIKTLSYILKRASTFILKPTKLQSELKEKLDLHDSKIDVIMKIWVKNTKPILDNLELEDGQSNQLEHIGWKMKLQLSSEAQQKEKIPLALVQLHTTKDNVNSASGEPITMEMNHVEVLDLYNAIEAIQVELDALKNVT